MCDHKDMQASAWHRLWLGSTWRVPPHTPTAPWQHPRITHGCRSIPALPTTASLQPHGCRSIAASPTAAGALPTAVGESPRHPWPQEQHHIPCGYGHVTASSTAAGASPQASWLGCHHCRALGLAQAPWPNNSNFTPVPSPSPLRMCLQNMLTVTQRPGKTSAAQDWQPEVLS